ncbi:MAG: hypothetical protein K2X93_17705 [Candidatus Obscuribacterales bacterium]|nr:hypothetical protein [Candidatus Obscuribacterales bacterium]
MKKKRWDIVLILYAVLVVVAAFFPLLSDFVCKPVAMVGAWAAVMLIARCFQSPRYYSGIIVQMVIVLLVSIFAFAASGILSTIATVVLLILIWAFVMQPHTLILKTARSLMRGDHVTALDTATKLRNFWWGKQADLYFDCVEFSIAVLDQQLKAADQILNKWRGDYSIPPAEQNRISGMQSDLYTHQHNWPRVIEMYAIESLKEPKDASLGILLNSARAYAETGHFEESAVALEKLTMNTLIPDLSTLTRIWICSVCAFGDSEHLENLFDGIELTEERLDDYEKNMWRSRCLLTLGRLDEAKTLLALSRKQIVALPDNDQIAPKAKSVINQIHYIDRLLSNNYCGPLAPATPTQLDRVKAVWTKIRAHAISRR